MAEIVDQPPPVRRDGVTSVQALVRADLEEREQVGIERYGTPLQAHNGRDALVDAYQEALDLACYLRLAIAERPAPAAAPNPCRESEGMSGIDCNIEAPGHPLPHRGWWREEGDETGEYAVYIEWPVPERPDFTATRPVAMPANRPLS